MQHITTQQLSWKLDNCRLGLYTITKVVSPYSYELEFPASIKHHHVQYVSLLDLVDDNLLPG